MIMKSLEKKIEAKTIQKSIILKLLLLVFFCVFSFPGMLWAQSGCGITKYHGDGYSTTINSVVDNGDGTYTIVLYVEHDGC